MVFMQAYSHWDLIETMWSMAVLAISFGKFSLGNYIEDILDLDVFVIHYGNYIILIG